MAVPLPTATTSKKSSIRQANARAVCEHQPIGLIKLSKYKFAEEMDVV